MTDRRRRRHHTLGGEEARHDAEQQLAEVRSRWPEIRRVAASLRELRQRNHFAEAVADSYRRRQP